MLPKMCEWTVIAFTKNHWILSIHSNFIQILQTKMKVGFTLVGPPSTVCNAVLNEHDDDDDDDDDDALKNQT